MLSTPFPVAGAPWVRPIERDYETLTSHTIRLGAKNARQSWIDEEGYAPRRRRDVLACKMCHGRADGGATFKKRPHIIPEALGNRTLFCNEECDTCNGVVGRDLEDGLVKYLSAIRATTPLPSKKGKHGAKHKVSGDGTYLKSTGPVKDSITFAASASSPGVRHTVLDSSTVGLETTSQRFRLVDVAKSIARMGVLIAPWSAATNMGAVRQWVLGEFTQKTRLHALFIPGPPTPFSTLSVYHARDTSGQLPKWAVRYNYAGVVLTWYGPKVPPDGFAHMAPHQFWDQPLHGQQVGERTYTIDDSTWDTVETSIAVRVKEWLRHG